MECDSGGQGLVEASCVLLHPFSSRGQRLRQTAPGARARQPLAPRGLHACPADALFLCVLRRLCWERLSSLHTLSSFARIALLLWCWMQLWCRFCACV